MAQDASDNAEPEKILTAARGAAPSTAA
jgi:hypothetical protein